MSSLYISNTLYSILFLYCLHHNIVWKLQIMTSVFLAGQGSRIVAMETLVSLWTSEPGFTLVMISEFIVFQYNIIKIHYCCVTRRVESEIRNVCVSAKFCGCDWAVRAIIQQAVFVNTEVEQNRTQRLTVDRAPYIKSVLENSLPFIHLSGLSSDCPLQAAFRGLSFYILMYWNLWWSDLLLFESQRGSVSTEKSRWCTA